MKLKHPLLQKLLDLVVRCAHGSGLRLVVIYALERRNIQGIPQRGIPHSHRQIERHIIEAIYANQGIFRSEFVPDVLGADCSKVFFCAVPEGNIILTVLSLVLIVQPLVNCPQFDKLVQGVHVDGHGSQKGQLQDLEVEEEPLIFQ